MTNQIFKVILFSLVLVFSLNSKSYHFISIAHADDGDGGGDGDGTGADPKSSDGGEGDEGAADSKAAAQAAAESVAAGQEQAAATPAAVANPTGAFATKSVTNTVSNVSGPDASGWSTVSVNGESFHVSPGTDMTHVNTGFSQDNGLTGAAKAIGRSVSPGAGNSNQGTTGSIGSRG